MGKLANAKKAAALAAKVVTSNVDAEQLTRQATEGLNRLSRKVNETASMVGARLGTTIELPASIAKQIKDDDSLPIKMTIRQRANTLKGEFGIYDAEGNALYHVEGKLMSQSTLRIRDCEGRHVATIKRRLVSLRAPWEVTSGGEVFEFEFRVIDRYIGTFAPMSLGLKPLSGKAQRRMRQELSTVARYTLSGTDWEIRDIKRALPSEIVTGSQVTIAKFSRSYSERADSYLIAHACKENELLYAMIVLALDVVHDERGMKERVHDRMHYGKGTKLP